MSTEDDRPPRPAEDQPADEAALATAATPDSLDDGGLEVLLPEVARMTSRTARIRALQTQVVRAIRLERTWAVRGCC